MSDTVSQWAETRCRTRNGEDTQRKQRDAQQNSDIKCLHSHINGKITCIGETCTGLGAMLGLVFLSQFLPLSVAC